MKIAIVGAGISGLTAAWILSRQHEVVLYEAEPRIGGHTHTVTVSRPEGDYRVDTGFIVFNDRTYPNFIRLLEQLDLQGQPAAMGFSVSSRRTGVEYSGSGLGGLFAQKRNLLSFSHWQMIADILRFNRAAPGLLDSDEGELPLGQYLRKEGYSERFRSHYILAMGAAIWSCSETRMENFPARFFVRFFLNHGLLALRNRPQWYVVPGGSNTYVDRLLQKMKATVRVGCPVTRVSRSAEGKVNVSTAKDDVVYDQVIMACHTDQALALLADADEREAGLLSAIPYQENEVVLHTDTRLLPERQAAWSSWNALLDKDRDTVRLSYNMNILQSIEAPVTFCVTLNATDAIDPQQIIGQWRYAHPVFTPEGVTARQQLAAINGHRNTWFCGAWCHNGFHEDGVVSALAVTRGFGMGLEDCN